MNREEAIAHGVQVYDTQHSMKRRSPWHDYHRKGTYMLTLVAEGRVPVFGELKGNAEAPLGSPDAPRVECSELGRAILRDEIGKMRQHYPQVEVWKVCIMPDHIHMIVRVNEDLAEKKHLGRMVAGFKGGCSKAAMRLNAMDGRPWDGGRGAHDGPDGDGSSNTVPSSGTTAPSSNTVPSSGATSSVATVPLPSGKGRVKVKPLFEPGYNDKILLHEGQLDNWKAYLDDNPRRLLLKRQNPQLFTVLYGMEVAGHRCQIVGNRFLLDVPDKVAVIVHRRYTDIENTRLREEWLACGERGGVLVSAAISPKEKEVLREAMNRGYRIILLRENGFPNLYKPSGESFFACSEGLLLQISPWEYHMEKNTITRAQCLELNTMAERIVSNSHFFSL